MSTVITVENLGKKYTLHHQQREQYTALRDVTTNAFTSLAKKLIHPFRRSLNPQSSSLAPAYEEDFWALKDVSFTVDQGDRIGIIGRNGAGKSTLLKILSRITEPTTGSIRIKGRVASLLEVGTGFHPELTGRENIYLNGAILGMGRAEIKKKFDEIVDFAEIEKFLDTPVKRYSSGMYVRLAFAVAAHLEPEILIVDEVLAVGDAQFQKKCLGKMEEVGKEGRTVLFVSHNLDAVERLCSRVIWLKNGRVVANSYVLDDVIKKYLFNGRQESLLTVWKKANLHSVNPYFDLLQVRLIDANGKILDNIFQNNIDITIEIEADIFESDESLNVGYVVYNENGNAIYWSCFTDEPEDKWLKLVKGKNILISKLPQRLLNEGRYSLQVMASLHSRQWLIEPSLVNNLIEFQILGGLSDSPFWYARRPGIIAPILPWKNKHRT